MTRLLFFAALREAAGTNHLDVDAATVGDALKLATARFGEGFERVLGICTVLHGDETVTRERIWDRAVGPTDEIALLPPVSGGQDMRMIDVGDKDESKREAVATCVLRATPVVRDRILAGTLDKGDAVSQAKVAGILAAKRTPELIPMCHPVRTTFVGIEVFALDDDGIEVRATVRGRDRTGFEMEALTGCSLAALTLYDMAKSADPTMRIEGLRLISKSGGKSGEVRFE